MAPGKANQRIVAERLAWVERMVDEIRALPLGSLQEFTGDRRNVGAAESCLRRALEALLVLVGLCWLWLGWRKLKPSASP